MQNEKNITPETPEQTFTIDEAAEYIGIKRRTFESLKLTAISEMRTAKDGKPRRVNVYQKSVLDTAKAEREKTIYKPAAEALQTTADRNADVATREDVLKLAEAIAGSVAQTKKLLAAVPEKPKKILDTSLYRDKYILNFRQALHLSGLTETELKTALTEKKIKATETIRKDKNGKVSITYKILRESLEQYCKSLFE